MTEVADNVHTPYDHQLTPWHTATAALVAEYAPPDGTVVDLGCGVGHILAEVRRRRPDVRLIGADRDQVCLDIAAGRVPGLGVVVHDLGEDVGSGRLPEADVFVVSHVLEHIDGAAAALAEVVGRLRTGGVAVVAVPNAMTPAMIFRHLRRRGEVNEGHLCAWDRLLSSNFLEAVVGVEVVRLTGDVVPIIPDRLVDRAPRLAVPVERAAARLLPWFTFSHIAVVRPGRSG